MRSLLRAGHAVWRHVDDFRLGASSVGGLIMHEPQLTPSIATYVRSVAAQDPETAVAFVEASLIDGGQRINDWQARWVLHAAEDLTPSPLVVEWLRSVMADPSRQARFESHQRLQCGGVAKPPIRSWLGSTQLLAPRLAWFSPQRVTQKILICTDASTAV